jgi:List-Bact-rpt repeat protein
LSKLALRKLAFPNVQDRKRPLSHFAGLTAAVLLLTLTPAMAQTPVGPNRPPQVPADFVITPFGYFHPSCVMHLAEDEELLRGGEVIQRADGTKYTVPVCAYPHYTPSGEAIRAQSGIQPPYIDHEWLLAGNTVTNGSFARVDADWTVPSSPLTYHSQTIYLFPGLEDTNHTVSILQPVLGWNSDFSKKWGIASWNCCPRGTADESTPVQVSPGDHIFGTVQSTCERGTLTCPKWKISTVNQSTGRVTTLNNTPNEGQTFNWAFSGALEVYSITQCTDLPASHYVTFYPTLWDYDLNLIDNPGWWLMDQTSGLSPQCSYGGELDQNQTTLSFGTYNLTVSNNGSGHITSNDGSMNCNGTCTQPYEAGSQETLSAWPDGAWVFTGWSGAGCSGTGTCTVSLTHDQSVTANYLPVYYLSVNTTGNGSVRSSDGFINCPSNCGSPYVANTPVTLISNPGQGWSLNSWSGPCVGNAPTCSFNMTSNITAGATFTQDNYTLTVSMSGQGSITSTDGFINCPGMCSHTYLSLTQIVLNAVPASGWTFSGWSGGCSGVGACRLTLLSNTGVSAYFMRPGSGLQFTTVDPCRLVDTRQTGTPVQGGTSQDFAIPQLGGCNIPSSATAYSLNVTVVPYGPMRYLTVWPAGLAQPNVSITNSPDGRVKAAATVVQAGTGGAISIYAKDTTNVILDINGYFSAPGAQTLQFYPLTPCRVIDTRNPDAPPLSGGQSRNFALASNSCLPQGRNIQAYSLNVTVVPYPSGQRLRYLTVWPEGETQPEVSTLNNSTATTVANAAIVPAGQNGGISVYASDSTQLVVDISGYFAAPRTGGLSLYPAPPCRVIDTRSNNGQPFQGEKTINVAGSPCVPPANAQAYVFNATVVPTGPLNYLTLWADPGTQPLTSTLNAGDGQVTSNMAIVPNSDGKTDAFASGTTQLILDISSYFAP